MTVALLGPFAQAAWTTTGEQPDQQIRCDTHAEDANQVALVRDRARPKVLPL
jgi:hypothetical protein